MALPYMRTCQRGVTLVELLIVVGIVITLTAALLPSFGGFSKSQALVQSAQNFAADVRLTQGKALAGAVYDDGGDGTKDNVWWGVFVCRDAGRASNSSYQLGYTTDPLVNSFKDLETKTLSAGIIFNTSSCTGTPFYFKRLTGQLSGSAVTVVIQSSDSSKMKTVRINEGGKIEID